MTYKACGSDGGKSEVLGAVAQPPTQKTLVGILNLYYISWRHHL